MSEFTAQSTVRDVLERAGEKGRELLLAEGYDVGVGFADVLSQWQSLEMAARAGRLRNLSGLVAKLNLERRPTP